MDASASFFFAVKVTRGIISELGGFSFDKMGNRRFI
jgi:hypothetical protein